MERIDWEKLAIAFFVAFAGFVLIVGDTYWWETRNNAWLSVGCSLVAAALISCLNVLLVDWVRERPIEKWKLEKIYATRSEKNMDSDPKLKELQYRLDGVAFGLKSFRTKQGVQVEDAMRRGVNVRLVTMDPDSRFVGQRELEEKEASGQIRNTIMQLVEWADALNRKGYKGCITVKGYSCMTLDFYWRMDNELYIGPYWYGWDSQQTVTYKFINGGRGFDLYTQYFDALWNDEKLMRKLTK